ncbi:MAG TPA: galactosyldiacylglycerol synthase [bacterium (Candidatus Stahlbacteria)]|nr:galactosyldiacylglycerol synthase [Candidatus Stahlbacteria bacterium]
MIKLYDKESGRYLGEITEEELQFLIDNLEEENLTDTDYYLAKATLDFLKDQGISGHLLGIIEGAMGDKDGVEIRYEKS